MEDLRSARDLIDKGAFMANLDLEDAYFLIRVKRSSRKYLRFRFKGQLYQFMCLPFGLCSSPHTFTKIMKPVVNKLRSKGKDYEACKNNVQNTIGLLEELGFIINYRKSTTTPNRRCVEYGRAYCKRLERAKWLALTLNNNDFEGFMTINAGVLEDLQWWRDNIMSANSRIKSHKYSIVITSDASRTGWGAEAGGVVTRGFWNPEDQKHHINYLELYAAFFALKCFAHELRDREVLLRIDNTTAIAYVNKAGGIRHPKLSDLAREIWQWCQLRGIWPRATYIPSKLNVEADAASRVENLDTEWELSREAFRTVLDTFGLPSIDLFASRINRKCVRFYSRYPDPDAESVDAFTAGVSPPSEQVVTSGRQIIRQAFVTKGIGEESIDIMLSSLSESTIKQYEGTLKKWLVFTQARNIDAFNPQSTEEQPLKGLLIIEVHPGDIQEETIATEVLRYLGYRPGPDIY
ncbi:uncharacterized protein LOC130677723 [Microplitis mediator]|uniref:uncharacterized protein LOC130675036 n=1 Tax=Microplitis mediator TaxID=375433 RepID=UPI002556D6D3|nr:uncharacterized protein LOC130675036 [Microplitis mediator]XP_057340558.1 uncharacterized protein LOC130677723 [Microplitis mediator]